MRRRRSTVPQRLWGTRPNEPYNVDQHRCSSGGLCLVHICLPVGIQVVRQVEPDVATSRHSSLAATETYSLTAPQKSFGSQIHQTIKEPTGAVSPSI
jgi:hypothetical protein